MEVIIFLGLLWLIYMGIKGSGTKSQPKSGRRSAEKTYEELPDQPPAHHWEPHKDYSYDFEVVGESNYQRALASLAGDHGDQSPNLETTATLYPERNNPHDKAAVKVTIHGKTVGYLSRDDAPRFRRRLSSRKIGIKPTTCNAMIIGGFAKQDGSKASYGVVLDMKPFD